MLVFPPGLDFLPALLGCMDAGVIAVPVRTQIICKKMHFCETHNNYFFLK